MLSKKPACPCPRMGRPDCHPPWRLISCRTDLGTGANFLRSVKKPPPLSPIGWPGCLAWNTWQGLNLCLPIPWVRLSHCKTKAQRDLKTVLLVPSINLEGACQSKPWLRKIVFQKKNWTLYLNEQGANEPLYLTSVPLLHGSPIDFFFPLRGHCDELND